LRTKLALFIFLIVLIVGAPFAAPAFSTELTAKSETNATAQACITQTEQSGIIKPLGDPIDCPGGPTPR
jgi:hypothetical protein